MNSIELTHQAKRLLTKLFVAAGQELQGWFSPFPWLPKPSGEEDDML